MSWLWLKSVPWGTILASAPALVDSARKLLERRTQTAPPPGTGASDPTLLGQRIQALEARQQQMAELLESLARNNEQLTAAVQYLRARAAWNFRIAVVLALAVAGLALRVLYG
ncbi:MAG TPA: hypothetical protein VNM24_13620 [Burkholderiales bacterium]|jgi:hypothetical protein|nr:hypothetical protein [Burkholderiales bacterium]